MMFGTKQILFLIIFFYSLLQMQSPAHAAMTFPVPELLQNTKQETSFALTSALSIFAGKQIFTTVDKKTATTVMMGMAIVYGCYHQYKYNSFSRFFANDISGLKNTISNTTINFDSLGSAVSGSVDYGVDRIPLCPTIVKEALKTILHYFGSRLGTYILNNKICVGGALLLHFAGKAVVNQSLADAGAGIVFVSGCVYQWMNGVHTKLDDIKKSQEKLVQMEAQHHKELLNSQSENTQQLEHTMEDNTTKLSDKIQCTEENIREDLKVVAADVQSIRHDIHSLEVTIEVRADEEGKRIEGLSKKIDEATVKIVSLIGELAIVSQNDKSRDNKTEEVFQSLKQTHTDLVQAKTEFKTFLEKLNTTLAESSQITEQGFREVNQTIETIRNSSVQSSTEINNKLQEIDESQISQGQALSQAYIKIDQLFEEANVHSKLLISIKQAQEATLHSMQEMETNNNDRLKIVDENLSAQSAKYLSLIEQLNNNTIENKEAMSQLVSRLESNKKESEEITKKFFDGLSERIQKVEKAVTKVSGQMNNLETHVRTIDTKVDNLMEKVNQLETNIPEETQKQLHSTFLEWQKKFQSYEEEAKKNAERIELLTKKVTDLTNELHKSSKKIENKLTILEENVAQQQQTIHSMGTTIIQKIDQTNATQLVLLSSSQGISTAPSIPLSYDQDPLSKKQAKPLTVPKFINKSSSLSSSWFNS